METNIILDKQTIDRKMRRMALEIAEINHDEKELIIAGIAGNGEAVAKKLSAVLSELTSISSKVVTLQLNKKDPLEVKLDPVISFEDKTVILVDDVSNTGKTMLYAMKPFLQGYPRSLQTLVLVERSHKVFPVETNYKGLSVSTTLQEHIYVEVENGELHQACMV
jgi:pyrimidine operon attenuation protein / uracil phosphoribosyltransferase